MIIMLKCPFCFERNNQCTGYIKKFESKDRGYVVKRQRVCRSCGEKFWGIEYVSFEDQGGGKNEHLH